MKGAQQHAEEIDGERKETNYRGGNADGVRDPGIHHGAARGGFPGGGAGQLEAQPVSKSCCL